ALVVERELLIEGLRDTGRDTAVHLALEDHRVDDRAGVVDRDQPQQLDAAGLRVDLDHRDVATERERRRRVELVLRAQLTKTVVLVRALGELLPREAVARSFEAALVELHLAAEVLTGERRRLLDERVGGAERRGSAELRRLRAVRAGALRDDVGVALDDGDRLDRQ